MLRTYDASSFRALLGSKFYLGHYYVGLALLTLATAFAVAIIRGPAGPAFQALRDNPGYAVSRGISKFKYQLWVFGLSAFFTGLAGASYAVSFAAVGPVVFSISVLLFLLSMIWWATWARSGAALGRRLADAGRQGDARGG